MAEPLLGVFGLCGDRHCLDMERIMNALSFFLLSSMWHPSSAAQARQVGLGLILPLLQGSVGQFLLPAPCPEALVHRTLKGVCSYSVRTPLTQRGRTSGRRGARRDCRGYRMLFLQGLGARVCFPNSLPSQSWCPRVLLQHSSPSRGLAWGRGEHKSPLFQQENSITELHSPFSVFLLAVPEWAGRGLCAKILLFPPWRWEE